MERLRFFIELLIRIRLPWSISSLEHPKLFDFWGYFLNKRTIFSSILIPLVETFMFFITRCHCSFRVYLRRLFKRMKLVLNCNRMITKFLMFRKTNKLLKKFAYLFHRWYLINSWNEDLGQVRDLKLENFVYPAIDGKITRLMFAFKGRRLGLLHYYVMKILNRLLPLDCHRLAFH